MRTDALNEAMPLSHCLLIDPHTPFSLLAHEEIAGIIKSKKNLAGHGVDVLPFQEPQYRVSLAESDSLKPKPRVSLPEPNPLPKPRRRTRKAVALKTQKPQVTVQPPQESWRGYWIELCPFYRTYKIVFAAKPTPVAVMDATRLGYSLLDTKAYLARELLNLDSRRILVDRYIFDQMILDGMIAGYHREAPRI